MGGLGAGWRWSDPRDSDTWTDDRERCRAAGIDDTVGFETKVVTAKAMVRRAIAKKIPFRWVTADAA